MIFSPSLRNPLSRTLRLLLSAMLFASLGALSLPAEDTNTPDILGADTAWQTLQHMRETPPAPLKQLTGRMYTPKELQDYYATVADQAGAVADQAKAFYDQFPADARAAQAREIYFNSLHTAVESSSTNRIAELEAATVERQKDPSLDEAGRFQLSLRLLHSVVSGRQYEGNEAMRATLEARARQLAKEYPNHPDGLNFLLDMARVAAPEKSAALAREILADTQDEKIKIECQGMINRLAAMGQPLDWKLALADGTTLDLTQWRGKVVLLFLWDGHSKYSSKGIWAVNNMYKTYHPKGVEFLGLNFDEKRESSDSMLKDNKVEWPQYFDLPGGKIQHQFGIYSLPVIWLLDKHGALREMHAEHGPMPLLDKLLAE
jgi:hypothetical protein